MPDEKKNLAYYLSKAEEYRKKAEAANEPMLKAALESVARGYMAEARRIDPNVK